jgi:ubiquinone/menaquinone biosynthesis C-methylase UbiE
MVRILKAGKKPAKGRKPLKGRKLPKGRGKKGRTAVDKVESRIAGNKRGDDVLAGTIRIYDEHAAVFANFVETTIPQYDMNKFVLYLKGKTVLDAGCGSGRDLRYFLDEKLKPVGVDLSIGMLTEAKARGKGDYLQMDMRSLGFRDKAFDGIWARSSVLHARKADVAAMFSEFRRVLKEDGVLYVQLIEGEGEKMLETPSVPGEKRFYSLYQQHEAEAMLQDAGFALLASYTEKDILTKYDRINIFVRKQG